MTIVGNERRDTRNRGRTTNDRILDWPELLRVLFHPRPEARFSPRRPGILTVTFEIEPGLHVGGRLYPAGHNAPTILFFHGNGEIAADYNGIAPLYTELGITLLVVDYRGYGISSGRPTASHLLADAMRIFEDMRDVLAEHNLAPARLYIMGRSLGSAAAIEVARHAGDRLAGLIVESGFADTFALLTRLGLRVQGADEARDGFGNATKIQVTQMPTLIIHGRNDVLIPASDGQELHCRSAAADKRLVLIPGAGHNDLLWVGQKTYFEAIQAFAGA
jgi:pimeloyl-ACP methyl ester carboxylesterase